jgi:hypothetical protein
MGSKTPVTLNTFPASSYHRAILAQAGIDHLIIQANAKGTLHDFTPLLLSRFVHL